VCKGDRVVVDVENQLPGSFETSIHWHGQLQRGTPFSDGVSKVTQCPVTQGFSFRYSFVADQPGTHLYYAHSGTSRFGKKATRKKYLLQFLSTLTASTERWW
jgi:L-ascorbate oxidase